MSDEAKGILSRSLVHQISQLQTERDALRAELAVVSKERDISWRDKLMLMNERDALREALKPFAEAAENFDTMPVKDPEGWFAYSGQSSFNKIVGAITVGDLRRARAALKGDGDE